MNGIVQLTREQAIAFAESGAWKEWAPAQRGIFQLYQEWLCMPFDVAHEGVEKALCRPVWTHEFADLGALRAEVEGRVDAPSMIDIVAKLVHLSNGNVVVMDSEKLKDMLNTEVK